MRLARKYGWIVGMLLIWSIIFSVPSCRHLLRAMVMGSPWMEPLIPYKNWDSAFGTDAQELPLRVDAVKGDPLASQWPQNFRTLQQLDHYIDENPNLSWLIALRLQLTLVTFRTNRIGGESSDPKLLEHLEAGIPSPEKSDTKINFTPEQLQHALELCQKGETLEPQNAFFSWMRACLLLMDWQDENAWQALQEAAQKTYWNDHYAEFVQLYLNSVNKTLKRPLLPFELELLSAPVINPSGVKMREICRIINWQIVKYKRAEESAKALQVSSDFQHTMFLAAHSSSYLMDFLIYSAMQSIAQSSVATPNRETLKTRLQTDSAERKKPYFRLSEQEQKQEQDRRNKKAEERKKRNIAAFAGYARRFHQEDLAQQIEAEATQTQQLWQKTKKYNEEKEKNFSLTPIFASGILFMLGRTLLMFSVFLVIMALFFACLFACLNALGVYKSTFPLRVVKGWAFGLSFAILLTLSVTIYANKLQQEETYNKLRGEMHLTHDVKNTPR